jgi:8-oxo-dGTP pyrophosphatase MutT (NUDIX family)
MLEAPIGGAERATLVHTTSMHRLQQHILQQLIMNQQLRYADIKPREVEGNLFMYHLRQLMKDGLVEKTATGRYQLTARGKLYSDRLSLKSLTPRVQPRIVTLMAVEGSDGRWLWYRRKRQPLIHRIGFPYGKIHIGESVQQAAARELKEKTGLEAELQHRGDGYATTYEGSEPVSEILFHLFYGSNPRGQLLERSTIGEPFWAHPEDLEADSVMSNALDLLQLTQSYDGKRFFAELSDHIEPHQ